LQEIPVVEGIAISGSRTSNFTRRDGSPGCLTQFELSEESGLVKIRTVIWDAAGLEVKAGQKLWMTNVRIKKNMNGERELHGDKGSGIIGVSAQKETAQPVGKLVKVDLVKNPRQRYSIEVMAVSAPTVHEVQLNDGSSAKKAEQVFADETGEITVI